MNTVVRKPEILRQLNDRYEVNRFLFINQLDLKHDLRDPNTAFLDPKRLLQVHYTFVDLYGKGTRQRIGDSRVFWKNHQSGSHNRREHV